jgi:hypothetical protein
LKEDERMVSRRKVIQGTIASGTAPLLAGTAGPAGAQLTPPTEAATRYRPGHRYLFQSVPQHYQPTRLPGGSNFNMEKWGPTHEYVDLATQWRWDRSRGDWLDADNVRHGPKAWASVLANKVSGASAVAAYTMDVTSVLQRVLTDGRWCAFLLAGSTTAPRTLATLHQGVHARPSIQVSYADGRAETLACRIMAGINTGQSLSITTQPKLAGSMFLEFERPRTRVAQATLSFVVVEHWSGSNPLLQLFLLDPPLNRDPVRVGVAQAAGPLDEGLALQPSIIGTHRYVDGSVWSDFTEPQILNTGAEYQFDPAIYGTGPADLTKLPHRSLGKWINASPKNWSLVSSGYDREGFRPLVGGMGAARIVMPKEALADGSVVGYSGTVAGNAHIFLPEPLYGRTSRIFVRHYMRIGTPDGGPYAPTRAERRQVYQTTTGAPVWSDMAGKFGFMPEHCTTFGGTSGSSGGGSGWQMRLGWADCDAEQGGPDEAGISPSFHLYDFWFNNPPGYSYAAGGERALGQRGGLGGVLYAHTWYCVECELKLNSVDQPAVLANGSPHVINGVQQYWTPDGEIRAWIDGRLVFERKGMVFRSLPLKQPGPGFDRHMSLRPIRELGVRSLWLNWYHGGTNQNTIDRVMFISNLAWGHEYIGPMRR